MQENCVKAAHCNDRTRKLYNEILNTNNVHIYLKKSLKNCEKTHIEQEREKISNDEKSSRLKNIDFLYSFSPLYEQKVQAHAISCKSLFK